MEINIHFLEKAKMGAGTYAESADRRIGLKVNATQHTLSFKFEVPIGKW